MKKSLMSMIGLSCALFALTVLSPLAPVAAQDVEKPAKPEDGKGKTEAEAKKYELVEKYEKGAILTDVTVVGYTMIQSLIMPDGSEVTTELSTEGTSVIQLEVLEVDSDGQPTKFRKTWVRGHSTAVSSSEGDEEAVEIEEDDARVGLVVVYTLDAESSTWSGEHEAGGDDLNDADLTKACGHQAHFISGVLLPGEKVGVGEAWKLSVENMEQIFKASMEQAAPTGQPEPDIEFDELKASYQIDSVEQTEDEGSFANISGSIEAKLTMQVGGMTLTGSTAGTNDLVYSMSQKRISQGVESGEMTLSGDVQGMTIQLVMETISTSARLDGKAADVIKELGLDDDAGSEEEKDDEEPKEGAKAAPSPEKK